MHFTCAKIITPYCDFFLWLSSKCIQCFTFKKYHMEGFLTKERKYTLKIISFVITKPPCELKQVQRQTFSALPILFDGIPPCINQVDPQHLKIIIPFFPRILEYCHHSPHNFNNQLLEILT